MTVADFDARIDDRYPVAPDADGVRPITPTDVAQFIRLDQCRRYLRLRLHERVAGDRFLRDYGVAARPIAPLLTRSGSLFEQTVAAAVSERFLTLNLAEGEEVLARGDDNARLIRMAQELTAGEILVLLQPRLLVELASWRIRGDADVVRLERDETGALHVLITDIKSTTAARIEHRLQVAFYHEMLATLFAAEAIAVTITTGILYRAPTSGASGKGSRGLSEQAESAQREAAFRLFNVADSLLELIDDPESYRDAVRDLVTGEHSVARNVVATPFAQIPYHLTSVCDGCLYNEFCMKWSAEHEDLSLLPYLTAPEKSALHRAGVTTIRQVAHLKEPHRDEVTGVEELTRLEPAPGQEELVRRLGASWPVGPRLDELIHRARSYRKFKARRSDATMTALNYIPRGGHGSLPYCAPEHNPNLVRVYLDGQRDYLEDRVYLLGALVTGAEAGVVPPERRRAIVRLSQGPPRAEETERDLFVEWIQATIRAIVEVAAPDAEGRARAPIHLIFVDRTAQRTLLEGLGRHATTVLGATPLYDFVTQLAAFDSPIASFLTEEIREQKNYPMICQSLQTVAAWCKFSWNDQVPYRERFKARLFDFWDRLDREGAAVSDEDPWYISRARFSSDIPLEYAYGAWGELDPPTTGERDRYADFRQTTPELLVGFQTRRLEAMEWITREFVGNRDSAKGLFDLPNLSEFDEKARSLAHAMAEFLTIERHVYLSAWKRARLPAPERRVLNGDSLIGRYQEVDQEPGVAELLRENERRRHLHDEQRATFFAANPDATRLKRSKEEIAATKASQDGLRLRLRLDLTGVDADLDQVLAITDLKPGGRLVVYPALSVDERLPLAERVPHQSTPRQMLYGPRVDFVGFQIDRDANGRAVGGVVEVSLLDQIAMRGANGTVFSGHDRPWVSGKRYTLEEDPNSWIAYWLAKVVEGLIAGRRNTVYQRLADPASAHATWPELAVAGQAGFLAGLDALHAAGALHDFEAAKRDFIGDHGATPTLLVQGPPGTGKSYSTAFALLARFQGAMAAGLEFRIGVSCNTHAAIDVLLTHLIRARERLAAWQADYPIIFAEYFDQRLLEIVFYRLKPNDETPAGAIALVEQAKSPKGTPAMAKAVEATPWCIVAGTPGAIYGMIKERWSAKELFGHDFIDCLVLDEASRLNLPEAAMAALPLKTDGQLIVVGDHRQMPPIVQHDWANENRRTFREYRTHESLFTTLWEKIAPHDGDATGEPSRVGLIQFEESHRLHTEMAEFLRREVYAQDGIAYHSHLTDLLAPHTLDDPYLAAVLAPDHPLIVVVHDEARSQKLNPFEQRLVAPMLAALAARGFDAASDLGVVVPHRAQRAALQEAVPALTTRDPVSGAIVLSAVDTVERFQGGERTVIVVSATESDPAYLLEASGFLLDPRRLTVSLSRAKRKLILVAARSVFDLFSPDEETFANARLWKNLLRRTCTVSLWTGEREGVPVEVWGNAATDATHDKQ